MPVEEWDDRQDNDNEITLIKLGNHIWGRKWFIGKTIGIFFIIGLMVYFLGRVEYESTATMLLEDDTQGQVSQLMQQFGFGSLSSSNPEVLPPIIYPEITDGLPFLMDLIGKEIIFAEPDTVVNAFTYFNTMYEQSAFDLIYAYTIGLPWQINGWLFGEEKKNKLEDYSSSLNFEQSLSKVYKVGGDTLKAIGELRDRINVTVDLGRMLEVVVEMPDPVAAAQVGQNTVELLKKYIKGYKTKKAIENLRFAQGLLKSAREDFEAIQRRLAEFKDSNINLVTAKAQIKEQQLQSEYELAFGVYNSMATKVADLKLKVQEQTPSFTTIHPFEVPRSPSQPNLGIILFISVFSGLFISLAIITGGVLWDFVRNKSI